MLYEVVKNNFFDNGYYQMVVKIDKFIEEPKSLKFMDRIKKMFTAYEADVVEVRYGEYEEKKVKVRYNQIVRKLKDDNKVSIHECTKMPRFNQVEREQIWELSEEYGCATVGVMAATVDYFTVEVLMSDNSRLKVGSVFYIERYDAKHLIKKVGEYKTVNEIHGYTINFGDRYYHGGKWY